MPDLSACPNSATQNKHDQNAVLSSRADPSSYRMRRRSMLPESGFVQGIAKSQSLIDPLLPKHPKYARQTDLLHEPWRSFQVPVAVLILPAFRVAHQKPFRLIALPHH